MTFDSKAGKETFWHTASHLMAQAVKIFILRQSLQEALLQTQASTMILR